MDTKERMMGMNCKEIEEILQLEEELLKKIDNLKEQPI